MWLNSPSCRRFGILEILSSTRRSKTSGGLPEAKKYSILTSRRELKRYAADVRCDQIVHPT